MKFSVLLSVYKRESPEFLRHSFDSVFNQTLPPDEVVLVEDGTLTSELYEAIETISQHHSNLKVVILSDNQGLGKALAIGMEHCQYDIVARMDTDDICMPQRFEKQIEFLEAHPDIDVVGAWISEFVGTPSNVVAIRNLPEEHEQIFQFGKSRNPINHPVVMFRKKAVLEAGGYQPFPLFEDYFLWVRMLMHGYRFHNLPYSLLLFRRSPEMMKRRGGHSYANNEVLFQKTLYKIGYITHTRMIKNIFLRYGTRIVPNSVRNWLYNRFLRIKVISNTNQR
jgi:glycosyltransferase involved in cell wall biosynthesis